MFVGTTNSNIAARAVRMAEICHDLTNRPLLTDLERHFVVKSFIRACADDLSFIDKSPHTIKNLFTDARKAVAAMDFIHGSVKATVAKEFVVAGAVMAEIKARAEVRRIGNSINVAVYDHVPTYVSTIERYLQSDLEPLVLVGVLAATGRRPVELRESNFELDYSGGDILMQSMAFSGQAKTRENVTGQFNIPVLVDSTLIMDKLQKFGSKLARVSVKKANNAFSEFASDVNWPDSVKCTAKNLRAMYACMTYALKAPDNMQEWAWVNMVLGHEEYDQVTCQAYMRFKVRRPVSEWLADEAKKSLKGVKLTGELSDGVICE